MVPHGHLHALLAASSALLHHGGMLRGRAELYFDQFRSILADAPPGIDVTNALVVHDPFCRLPVRLVPGLTDEGDPCSVPDTTPPHDVLDQGDQGPSALDPVAPALPAHAAQSGPLPRSSEPPGGTQGRGAPPGPRDAAFARASPAETTHPELASNGTL